MIKAIATATFVAMTVAAIPAFAGVVITQTETVEGAAPTAQQRQQTITVEGHKQRIDSAGISFIVNLDTNRMFILQPSQKSFVQLPFPPTGSIGKMMAESAGAMDFKKETTSRKILGYACDDYSTKTSSATGDVSIVECFSKTAPGAKEYDAYTKVMLAKFKESGLTATGEVPEGVPLASDVTIKMTKLNLPGLSPEQQAKLAQMMKNRKPVTRHTIVTKIAEQQPPANTFVVPADYKERKLPTRGANVRQGAGAHPAPASPSVH